MNIINEKDEPLIIFINLPQNNKSALGSDIILPNQYYMLILLNI